ncbi:hypothetical protein ACH5RR_006773 [Cinchona calisaya]|uniref:Uncharacterized protein n=1 Tax=Cinchona calisaya TaxID=153742 RepID=A0ABD3APY0_9GENT
MGDGNDSRVLVELNKFKGEKIREAKENVDFNKDSKRIRVSITSVTVVMIATKSLDPRSSMTKEDKEKSSIFEGKMAAVALGKTVGQKVSGFASGGRKASFFEKH